MSGGHWNYLGMKIEERMGQHPGDVWQLLSYIEHELDYGISGDICYECAKIRVIDALEAYFDTEATDVKNSLRILNSQEDECEYCKSRRQRQKLETLTVTVLIDGKEYRGGLKQNC